ncbi:hypothetical protein GIB67_029459 [Kingdonia uniflora]|uniref:1-(5-phosphoribosyl)-5-[(5-phosphoribosylamino)methylideneamino] imidazole-4-carboxamide isomerase HISN3, chloroplastic n=1 Tax=Kingdonia uniflora TaxID=39325 RepID=A0A7J7NXU8_9MAGN|nr:hypothetical protein GIB67_029459 [Kingdonia uniflora]
MSSSSSRDRCQHHYGVCPSSEHDIMVVHCDGSPVDRFFNFDSQDSGLIVSLCDLPYAIRVLQSKVLQFRNSIMTRRYTVSVVKMRISSVSGIVDSQNTVVSASDLKSIFEIPHSSIQRVKSLRFIKFMPLRCSRSLQASVQCVVRFRPCIDIHKGKVKQIVGSTLQDLKDGGSGLITNFESDKSAAEFAILYKKDSLTGGHVIMLGADSLSRSAAVEALHAYPDFDEELKKITLDAANGHIIVEIWFLLGSLQVGGGINLDNALGYLEEGASHVIVTSYVFNNGHMDLERLRDLVRLVGKQRLVLDLSCRKKDGQYAIVTDRWQKFSDVCVNEKTLEFLAAYADEFLVHGVDVEGKRLGIDEELVALLGRYSPPRGLQEPWDRRSSQDSSRRQPCLRWYHLWLRLRIPVTYAGGVTIMEDLERIKVAGMNRVDVTVGSALDIFGGDLAYEDVAAWHQKQEAADWVV